MNSYTELQEEIQNDICTRLWNSVKQLSENDQQNTFHVDNAVNATNKVYCSWEQRKMDFKNLNSQMNEDPSSARFLTSAAA